ncbi:VOC family protein [Labedella populi]|uniref:VOC family protein n=1 Tax=Labedella populi TaxID=2498850 RepID=UPI0031333A93
MNVPEPKTIKNRLHLDFAGDDRAAGVGRLLGLGATHADVGQSGGSPGSSSRIPRATSSASCPRADVRRESQEGA